MSPSSASGERTPPAPSTSTTPRRRRAAQLGARSAIGERRSSPSSGGGHRRRHRRRRTTGAAGTPRRVSPVAAASTSASVVPRRSGANDCTGLRARDAVPSRAQAPGDRRRHPRLADFGAGAGDETTITRRPASPVGVRPSPKTVASAATRRLDVLVGVRGGERHAQAGRAGRRRSADGWRAPASPARAARGGGVERGAARRRTTNGTIGDGCPGRNRSTCARRRGDERVALGRLQHRERGERGGGVGGRRRGREDVRPARFLDQLDVARRPGDEAAERAERLRERADAHDVVVVGERRDADRARRGLRRAPADAPCRAHDRPQGIDVGDVAVHREHRVADDDGAAVAAACQQRRRGASRSPWR